MRYVCSFCVFALLCGPLLCGPSRATNMSLLCRTFVCMCVVWPFCVVAFAVSGSPLFIVFVIVTLLLVCLCAVSVRAIEGRVVTMHSCTVTSCVSFAYRVVPSEQHILCWVYVLRFCFVAMTGCVRSLFRLGHSRVCLAFDAFFIVFCFHNYACALYLSILCVCIVCGRIPGVKWCCYIATSFLFPCFSLRVRFCVLVSFSCCVLASMREFCFVP